MKKIREVEEARRAIRRTIRVLEEHGDRTISRSLQHDLDRMGNWFATRSALCAVEAASHPRGLGDNFLPGMRHSAWTDRVAGLAASCRLAVEALDRLGPEERQRFAVSRGRPGQIRNQS